MFSSIWLGPKIRFEFGAFGIDSVRFPYLINLCVMWQRWTDDYLEWEPSEYGGVREIIVPPSKIWLPDFGIANRSVLCCAL